MGLIGRVGLIFFRIARWSPTVIQSHAGRVRGKNSGFRPLIICGGLFLFITRSLISQYFLSREDRMLLARLCAEVIGVLLV